MKTVDTTILFLSMGLFSTAIAKAGVLGIVQAYLQSAADTLGLYSVILLPLLMILTSFSGIHPFGGIGPGFSAVAADSGHLSFVPGLRRFSFLYGISFGRGNSDFGQIYPRYYAALELVFLPVFGVSI